MLIQFSVFCYLHSIHDQAFLIDTPTKKWPRICSLRCKCLFSFPATSHALTLPFRSSHDKHSGGLLKSIQFCLNPLLPPFTRTIVNFKLGTLPPGSGARAFCIWRSKHFFRRFFYLLSQKSCSHAFFATITMQVLLMEVLLVLMTCLKCLMFSFFLNGDNYEQRHEIWECRNALPLYKRLVKNS